MEFSFLIISLIRVKVIFRVIRKRCAWRDMVLNKEKKKFRVETNKIPPQ